jgi:hypothetical protein
LTISLTSKEIKRKRLLVSKFKEDAINHIEKQELMAILEREKQGLDKKIIAIFGVPSILFSFLGASMETGR